MSLKNKKWNKQQYSSAANILRKAGYDIPYNKRRKDSVKRHGIIRRIYEDKKSFLNFADFNDNSKSRDVRGTGYHFKFQPLTKSERKKAKASGLFSGEQFTKRGLLIEKPVNLPSKEYKVTFGKGGEVSISGGKRSDIIRKLDAEALAVDPYKAVKAAVGKDKPSSLSLMVNGFRSRHFSSSVNQMAFYLKNELLPQWMDKNAGKQDSEDEAFELFSDIFHIRMLMHDIRTIKEIESEKRNAKNSTKNKPAAKRNSGIKKKGN